MHPLTENTQKSCKVCSKRIIGRTDKIFCSTDCKNHHHKVIHFETHKASMQIDACLHRNYTVLSELTQCGQSSLTIQRNTLEMEKFQFKYHTHIHVCSKGNTFFYVYDIAWRDFSEHEILIVRH